MAMRHPWRCKQCVKFVEEGRRRDHLWDAHLVDVLDESYIIDRFFTPAFN